MELERMNISKRPIPSEELLSKRKANLEILINLELCSDFLDAPLFEPGNSKTGESSKIYERILVWNLPAIQTCPGASEWCKSHCYNGEDIVMKYPATKWIKNYSYFLSRPEELRNKLIATLNEIKLITAVRIHSSGDFFSSNYIKFWHEIIKASPNTYFWAYTRTWSIKKLLPYLERLRTSDNIQLFASWDETMPNPPEGWRKSFVYLPQKLTDYKGLICPEQSGLVPNCATCNYCIGKKEGNVYFVLH